MPPKRIAMSAKVRRIDYGKRLLKEQAEKRYDEGDFLAALRFTGREVEFYGADADALARLADIYENMGLYTSALNCWYRFADSCTTEDLPDAYEGLAVNYLNLGNDVQSAYYYNKLIDADATLTSADKAQIAETFAAERENGFRFVYPPEIADYRAETSRGATALKNGDLDRAIYYLSQVKKGSKEYAAAQDMTAVALLLKGDAEGAEEICADLLKEYPEDVQALSTLSAIYAEEDRRAESKQIADKLCSMTGRSAEEKYKIATVACENGMHEKALELFSELEKEIPYDGNLLYFKAVAAAECGNDAMAESALARLIEIYPDAEVAKYYLGRLRLHKADPEKNARPAFTYFYKVPQEEKERRILDLEVLLKTSAKSAATIGDSIESEGFFRWCFDEMDGMETELQFLAITAAAHAGAAGSEACDDFLRGVLLDCEVKDALKIEALRLLFERGKECSFGVVICNVYKEVYSRALRLGKTKRKTFLRGYAEAASKFSILGAGYTAKIAAVTEKLYADLAEAGFLETVKTPAALAAAIYAEAGLKEAGGGIIAACALFAASEKEAGNILSAAEVAREAGRILAAVATAGENVLAEINKKTDGAEKNEAADEAAGDSAEEKAPERTEGEKTENIGEKPDPEKV